MEPAAIHDKGVSPRPLLRGVLCSLAAFAVGVGISLTAPARSVENALLDLAYRTLGAPARPSRDIVLLLVDTKSLVAMPRIFAFDDPKRKMPAWQWQRLFFGAVADFLRQAGAKAVAMDLDFFGMTPYDYYEDDSEPAARAFAASGIAYLPINFKRLASDGAPAPGESPADPQGIDRLDAILAPHAVTVAEERPLPSGDEAFDFAQLPYGPLAGKGVTRRLGFVNATRDPDGRVRRASLLVRYEGSLYPSLSLAVYLDVKGVKRVSLAADGRLELDDLSVPLDADGRYCINWYGPEQTFPSFTIYEAICMALADYERRCPPGACADPLYWNGLKYAERYSPAEVDAYAARFKGKIVFIGVNASELGDLWSNPFSEAFPGVEVHATVLSNLLDRRMLERPPLALRLAILFAIACMLGLGAGALGGEKRGLALWIVAIAAYLGLFAYSFRIHLLWLDAATPIATGSLAYAAVTLAHYFSTGRLRRQLRRTFDRVLQPALVDLLLRDPRQLELRGESRNLTVLFSDIKDFTPFAESLPAPELFTALNEYFALFTGIVIARGAYLDKYLGDGAMAVWGAPVPAERHAAAACLAALELTTQLRQLHWERRGRGAPGPLTRLGINSGDMVVGMVGSTETAHYTVMGDNVVVASRLEGVNKVYGTEILIGEGCYLQASQDIEAREIDLVVLKGKTRPLRIYEVICPAGALRPGDREKLDLFARGLALYRERRWREAEGAFANVLALDPNDGPAAVFFERCRRCAAKEPPSGWQGGFVMAEK